MFCLPGLSLGLGLQPAACSGSAEVKHDNKINKWENKKG